MDKFFKISERGSNVKTEIVAGLTTFFAMAYIVITNPNQITSFSTEGALGQIWNAVYVASILVAVIGTLMMALYAKMPFAQACGMGLNSFFFVCFILPNLISGGDLIAGYQSGLVIILVSGIVFMIFSLTGLRSKVAKALPECLKKSIPAGIGLFIAFIGFQNVGIIQANQYTLVQFNDFHGAIANGEFLTASLPALLALLGLIVIAVLEKLNAKGSVLITIAGITVLYYVISGTTSSFDMSQIGQAFKDFGAIGVTGVFQASAWKDAFTGPAIGGVLSAVMLVITFCLVDMFDTIGTLYGCASQANMLDENGDPINVDKCMTCDSVATVAGAVLGTSTCTTFVESASGVEAGGRTGLTAMVTGVLFLVSMFFAPIFTAIPSFATAPALIMVGFLMFSGITELKFDDDKLTETIPAYLAILAMPLFYSISEGIALGIISYVLLNVAAGKGKKVAPLMYVLALLFVLKYVFL